MLKAKVALGNITDLNDLPQPYQEIIQQLSVWCLQALHKNQLVFTLEETKLACSKIESIPGAINAFRLLQAVEHYSVDSMLMGTATKTLNFIHSSVQEFLAAYQISCLPYIHVERDCDLLRITFSLIFTLMHLQCMLE